jgi:DNA-directed RNA polymerase subunit RPC12/RpoP
MKCSSCGRDIDKSRFPANITFCPFCGDELHSEEDVNEMQFCTYCGEKLIIKAAFCPHCGKKLLISGKAESSQRTEPGKIIHQAAKPVIESIKENIGPERKMRKLYKQWIEYSNLPPEEIPSINKDIEERNRPRDEEVSGNDYRDFVQ